MATNYLFDNAVLDRCARLANGLEVEPEIEFAERLLWMTTFPASQSVEELDSFINRVNALSVKP